MTLPTTGCALLGADGDKPVRLEQPAVVELTPVRCPPVDAAARAEFRSVTTRPMADTVNADGSPAVSKAAVRSWIDALEVSERRKNAVGQRVVAEADKCRRAAAPSS